MITQECDIYVEGKQFVKPADLIVGDQVYTIDEQKRVALEPIVSLTSDWVSGRINSIDSGAHNVDVTDDARLLYESENHGSSMIPWSLIPAKTPDKRYDANKYLPVLSWMEQSEPQCTLAELEYIARMCASYEYDRTSFKSIVARCTGSDALVLIDMLEFWLSTAPGKGWFDRAQVKTRSHRITDKYILDELCKLAVLAGFTAAVSNYEPYVYALKVSYAAKPIPGSRPKNEKYFKRYYTGLCYNINAGNKPIMGRSRSRVFYLPTSSILNEKG